MKLHDQIHLCNVSFLDLAAFPDNVLTKYYSRRRHQRCSVRKGVLRNSAQFTGKDLCQSLFFNKVAGMRPATLLK